jgi:hypothetical protein
MSDVSIARSASISGVNNSFPPCFERTINLGPS